MKRYIYLDNNASTPLDKEVIEALHREMLLSPANASSIHFYGRKAKERFLKAKDSLAKFFHVRPSELIFTSGGTESINFLLFGLFQKIKGGHIISTSIEHSSMLKCLEILKNQGTNISYLETGSYGAPTPQSLAKLICTDTKGICLSYVNNETGVKIDLDAIAALAKEKQVPLVIDAVAAIGKIPLLIPEGVTGIAFSSHKIHGPQGIGLAFVKQGTSLSPLIYGGGQENGKRSGTENLPGIIGFTKAVEILNRNFDLETKKILSLRDLFEQIIFASIKNVSINGEGPRVCNTSNLFFEGIDGELLLLQLDREKIAASLGSACASGGLQPSHVLLGMGYSMKRALSSLRFSFSRLNTEEETIFAAKTVCKLVENMRSKKLYHY